MAATDPFTLLMQSIASAVGGPAAGMATGAAMGSSDSGQPSGPITPDASTNPTPPQNPQAPAPATPPAASGQNWLGRNSSTIGNALSALKSVGAAPEPKFSGGFQGPSLPYTQSIQPRNPIQDMATMNAANKPRTLGELLSDSPYGYLRK